MNKVKIDNSEIYNYHDEDTVYFVNFKNLVLTTILTSYIGTMISIPLLDKEAHVGVIALRYLFYIGLMIFQIFVVFNYRFLIKKKLKRFSIGSFLFIILHSAFYIFLLTFMQLVGNNFISIMNRIFG